MNEPIVIERAEMSVERVDENGGAAQGISVRSLFPCFSCRSHSSNSKYLSLTRQEYDEVNIGAKNYLCKAGSASTVSD